VLQNGRVSTKSNAVDAGCEIIVPSKPEKKPIDFSRLQSMGTTLASLATVIVALTR
jgi:hypothetical protein